MGDAKPEYKLSAELAGHSLDARGVAAGPEGCLLSASRDGTARLWHPRGARDFSAEQTYRHSSDAEQRAGLFVASVCYVGPCARFPRGCVATACRDGRVRCYRVHEPLPALALAAHADAACFVAPGRAPATLLSAGWDATAKLWSLDDDEGGGAGEGKEAAARVTLRGHAAAVWGVAELGDGNLATASADKAIFVWSARGEKIRALTGHSDCVRALAVASAETFLSCANDATIKLWTNKGDCLNTFYGHSNYIYSISVNPFSEKQFFASCGEDSTVRIWEGGDNVCTIALPAQSVWCVACLPNGDVVTGSSDGIVRVFTKDPTRRADEPVLKSFEENVAKHLQATTQEIGGFKVSELPGPESLFEPGKSDGQTKLVRFGDKVKCYSWNKAANNWNELGEVTGSAKPSEGKQAYQGKEYDYVFDVDIEDGKPPLKLPYNSTEDPWVAAQAFIHKNFLPQAYLEQVANFIIQNANKTTTASANSDFVDPFTGGARYVPGTNGSTNQFAGVNADPFTGSSSYSTSGNTGSQAGSQAPAATYFPQKTYLRFDQANVGAMVDKILEFNKKLDDKYIQVSEDSLRAVMRFTDQNAEVDYDVLGNVNVMLLWPKNLLFPVLDALRLMIRNKDVNAYLFKKTDDDALIMRIVLDNLTPDSPSSNQMLGLRVLCNAFIHLEGEMSVLKHYEDILNLLICLQDINKNIQIAAATLLLNLSVALGQTDPAFLCMCIIQTLDKLSDPEATFRAMVALGTILTTAPSKTSVTSIIVSHDKTVEKIKSYSSGASDVEPKLIKCCKEIVQLL